MKVKDLLIRQKENCKVAITYRNEKITYKDWYKKASFLSKIILAKQANRNIGLFFQNSIDYAIGYFSIALADKVLIPLENTIKSDSLQGIINYCEISLILTNNENVNVLKELLMDSQQKVIIININTFESFQIGANDYITQGIDDEEDVFIMLHTSGTTSDPKKVMLTNKNLITNIESNIKSLNLGQDDISLIILPMFFGYCNSSQFLSHLYVGASLVIYDSSFLPKKFLKMIEENKCTNTTCVPSMLFLIIKYCESNKFNLKSLRYLCFGGGKMPVDMLEKIISFFNTTGIIQTYGQTEAGPRVSCLMPNDAKRKIGSVGKAIPNVEIKIVDKKDIPVKRGEIGQIIVKGENVMKGYYKKPEITKETLKNGWLHTGDLGREDDEGYLYIVGRIKNVIISGGLNIYPEEIEEVLINYPPIKEVVVLPESHEILSEIPIAKVVLKEEEVVTPEEIIKYCMKKLPANKVPSKVLICDNLPKTYTGKIKRK